MTLKVTSTAFANEQTIPARHTCKGENSSPPLAWDNVPAGTKSFALIVDDPDAPSGTFVHWVIFNIPPAVRMLPGGIEPAASKLTDGTVQGVNGMRATGYTGPCPPSGKHRYYFRLYALDTTLSLDSRADKRAVVPALQGHILAQGQIMGYFAK